MKKIYLLIALSIFTLTSCKKNSPKAPCETNHTGVVKVINNSSNPYTLSVNNVFKIDILAGHFVYYSGKSEIDVFTLQQKSGYIFSPNVYTAKIFVSECDTTSWGPHP